MLSGSEIARIAEWLTKKVDSVTLKTCAEPKDAQVGGAGHATPRSGATMTPKEAVRGLRSWPMLYNSGILGQVNVQGPQKEASGIGTAAVSVFPGGTGTASAYRMDPKTQS